MKTGSVILLSVTKVAGLGTITPPFLRPMNAMKIPRPTEIAWRNETGIASMIASRRPQNTNRSMTIPSMNTIAIDVCQSLLVIRGKVNATIASRPKPVASATGRFEISPIRMVTRPEPMQVAVIAAFKGIPACTKIAGLTAIIYAIAKNVVRPALHSCETEEPLSLALKNVSISILSEFL